MRWPPSWAWRSSNARLGGRQAYATIARAEFSTPEQEHGTSLAKSVGPHRELPSRHAMMARSFAWYAGVCTALVTLFALTVGIPQRPELMQQITDAGAKFEQVRMERVSDIQHHDPSRSRSYYTSTAAVELRPEAGGEPVTVTVHPRTQDRPHAEMEASVLYAPSNPQFGAIAGDEDSLGSELTGFTMQVGERWIVGIAWVAGIVLSVVGLALNYGFRSSARSRGADRAVRTTCLGTGLFRRESKRQVCLQVATESARTAHFLVPITQEQVPSSLTGQQLWLRWDARRGTRGGQSTRSSTPAALVSDDGWVMHGTLPGDDAEMLSAEGVSIERAALWDDQNRPLRLWDPRSAWPLYVARSVLVLATAVIGCAVLLAFDFTGAVRSTLGIVAAVIVLTLCVLVTAGPHKSHIRAAVSEGEGDTL